LAETVIYNDENISLWYQTIKFDSYPLTIWGSNKFCGRRANYTYAFDGVHCDEKEGWIVCGNIYCVQGDKCPIKDL